MELLEDRVKGKRVLVAGIGGGGDVASAYCLAEWLESLGAEPVLASIIWERMVRDPIPGPISPKELHNAEIKGSIAILDGDEYALRNGNKVEPQATLLAKALGIEVIALDLKGGYASLKESIKETMEMTESDLVFGVDAGGDVLAKPGDEDVWSPLADSIALAVLQDLPRSVLTVAGPGCDGELPTQKVLERIAEVWRKGGNLGGFVVSKELAQRCFQAIKYMSTEASRMILEATTGTYGEVKIRRGSRTLEVTPVMATFFNLDPRSVESPLAEAVKGTSSIEEASEALLNLCSMSELELEKELKALGGWSKENLEEAKRRVLKKRRC